MNSKDPALLCKFFTSDRFYNPDQAVGRLFYEELEDWRNLIAHVGNVDGISSTEKSGLLILKYDYTSHFNIMYLN